MVKFTGDSPKMFTYFETLNVEIALVLSSLSYALGTAVPRVTNELVERWLQSKKNFLSSVT